VVGVTDRLSKRRNIVRRSTRFLLGVIAIAAAVTSSDATRPALAATNAAGQQNPAYCNQLQQRISDVLVAVNHIIPAASADAALQASLNKPAAYYTANAVVQLNAAVAKINELKVIIGTAPVTYAAAFSVNGYMVATVNLLQQARYWAMVSASNNQSQGSRASFNAITRAIAMAELTAALGGRCYMSPYTPG
jgi:hypothetical protein